MQRNYLQVKWKRERPSNSFRTYHVKPWGSLTFPCKWSRICELSPWYRALCLFDQRVTVTFSSTCKSLTSARLEWAFSSSTIGSADGEEGENEHCLSGDKRMLPSGLIWVAISLLETARGSVAASLMLSWKSSVHIGNKSVSTCQTKISKYIDPGIESISIAGKCVDPWVLCPLYFWHTNPTKVMDGLGIFKTQK